MGYLAEELSDNTPTPARDVECATAAMRYEGVEATRDRTFGAGLSGDANRRSPQAPSHGF
jgi:predicted lipid-binding transport protein (Tim44 family)